MNNPLFSILIANYNNGHFFKDCYESIIAQTYENWEVIMVDDASTDDSLAQIKQLIGDDSRFTILQNKKNKGCGFTKRKCAELATGVICGFLDPDDTLEPNALQLMVEIHQHKEAVSIVTSKYFLVDLKLNKLEITNQGEAIPKDFSYLTYGKGALTAFASFKNSLYKHTKGINAKFKRAVDQDLYYKMEEVGEHFFLDKPIYNYRIHENSISANSNIYKAKYWHFVAINDAYQRRLKMNTKVINFSKPQMKKMKADYYMARYGRLAGSKSKWNRFYFMMCAICAYPTYNFGSKVKKMILIFWRNE